MSFRKYFQPGFYTVRSRQRFSDGQQAKELMTKKSEFGLSADINMMLSVNLYEVLPDSFPIPAGKEYASLAGMDHSTVVASPPGPRRLSSSADLDDGMVQMDQVQLMGQEDEPAVHRYRGSAAPDNTPDPEEEFEDIAENSGDVYFNEDGIDSPIADSESLGIAPEWKLQEIGLPGKIDKPRDHLASLIFPW